MDNRIVLFFISLFCLLAHSFISCCLRSVEKLRIIEVGYRNKHPQKQALSTHNGKAFWENIVLVRLYKNVKINQRIAKKYFICNLCILIADVISVALCFFVIITNRSLNQIVRWQLGYTVAVVLVWGGAHFILDALYSPSERKRRGIE